MVNCFVGGQLQRCARVTVVLFASAGSQMTVAAEEDAAAPAALSKHRRHRKDKPWDTPDVDHWRIEPWSAEQGTGPFLEESSFATLFPKYREAYLREVWPHITKLLE